MSPVEINLKVRARLYKQGKWWIADCPALGVVVQMETAKAAEKEFALVLQGVLEISKEDGTFDELMRHASAQREIQWESACSSYGHKPLTTAQCRTSMQKAKAEGVMWKITPKMRDLGIDEQLLFA